MTIAAYRDRTSGEYPIPLATVRSRVNVAFGEEPTAAILDEANVDPVEAVAQPAFDPATHSVSEGPPERIGGRWRQTWVLTALPPAPAPITYKADVWRRSSSAQAAFIDTELQKLDVRLRRMWDDAMFLSHDDDLVVFFKSTLVTAFGQAEADRIMEPSNV